VRVQPLSHGISSLKRQPHKHLCIQIENFIRIRVLTADPFMCMYVFVCVCVCVCVCVFVYSRLLIFCLGSKGVCTQMGRGVYARPRVTQAGIAFCK